MIAFRSKILLSFQALQKTWIIVKRSLILLTICSLFFMHPLPAYNYDLGSGETFNEEGSGYEHSYCVPSFLEVTVGVLGSAAIIVGIIAIANSGSSSHEHV